MVSNAPVDTPRGTAESAQSAPSPSQTKDIAVDAVPDPKAADAHDARHDLGEMTLPGFEDHHGTECAPQKLVQLVGYRDSTAEPSKRRRRPSRTR